MQTTSPSASITDRAVYLQFNARSVLWSVFCAAITFEVALLLLDYAVNYSHGVEVPYIRRLFNITREDGLASWFAVTQTFVVALTLAAIWIVARGSGARPWTARGWLALALFFLYLAIDDGAAVHERLGSTLNDWRAENLYDGFPSYAWQIIFVPIFAAFGLFMLVFLYRNLETRRQRLGVFAAMGCMAAAIGLDFIEGLAPEHSLNLYSRISEAYDFESFTQQQFEATEFEALVHFSKAVEETIEMLAMTLLLVVFLSQLMRLGRDMKIRFLQISPILSGRG